MGRRRKGPWQRKGQTADKHWYTTLGRETVKVADQSCTYDEAFRKYAELLADSSEVPASEMTVKNLVTRFLKWTQKNRSPATFKFYERYLTSFCKEHGTKRLRSLQPNHVDRWVEANYFECSPTTQHDIMKTVARAINWGIKKAGVKHNPLIGMEKPSRQPRELVISQEQFQELLSHVPDDEFQDYLLFMWNTGCRAMEVKALEKRHFDGSMLTLPASEAKGKKHPRVIYLNEVALGIVQRLVAEHPTGPLFRRPDCKPWTANAVRLRFRRKTPQGKVLGLAEKLGIPGLCATTLRHSWATNALKNGMDSTTASILMGHRDPATLIRNYQHLTQDQSYLLDALRRLPTLETEQAGAA